MIFVPQLRNKQQYKTIWLYAPRQHTLAMYVLNLLQYQILEYVLYIASVCVFGHANNLARFFAYNEIYSARYIPMVM